MISSNSVAPEAVQRFQEAVPGATCQVSGYASFEEDVRKIVAHVLRVKAATISPDSLLSELGLTGSQRTKLIEFLRNDYFQLDDDNAENLGEFVRRTSSDETMAVTQLADLIQQTVGR
jgi:hypothetical protein